MAAATGSCVCDLLSRRWLAQLLWQLLLQAPSPVGLLPEALLALQGWACRPQQAGLVFEMLCSMRLQDLPAGVVLYSRRLLVSYTGA